MFLSDGHQALPWEDYKCITSCNVRCQGIQILITNAQSLLVEESLLDCICPLPQGKYGAF